MALSLKFVLPACVVLAGAGTLAVTGDGGEALAAPTAGTHPVAVELFTSQGCSSCPPADALLNKLSHKDGVVAISRPVTYWDQLGWKDTLAKPANTELQRNYTRRKISGAGVYTPQMVVQGRAGTVGSHASTIRKLIGKASHLTEPGLAIRKTADGGRRIGVRGKPPGTSEVVLVALAKPRTVKIGRGENGGRSVTYANVLMNTHKLGDWKGGDARFTVKPADMKVSGADRYALLIRQGDAGPILAARYL